MGDVRAFPCRWVGVDTCLDSPETVSHSRQWKSVYVHQEFGGVEGVGCGTSLDRVPVCISEPVFSKLRFGSCVYKAK